MSKSKYSGCIDLVVGNTVSGWAWNAQSPSDGLFVDVTDSLGRTIRTQATLPRDDLRDNNIADGRFGFSATFAATEEFCDLTTCQATIAGTKFKLNNLLVTSNDSTLKRATNKIIQAGKLTVSALDKRSPQKGKSLIAERVCYGKIVNVSGGRIDAWVDGGENSDLNPMVFVGNVPAWKDPSEKNFPGQPATSKGYSFYVSGITPADEISLWGVSRETIELCEAINVTTHAFERSILTQLERAARVAKQPNAVAITCWDGGHNPIGRANVLYEILRTKRPVVLFAFMFGDFGGTIWSPLDSASANIVTIPWANRFFYLKMAQAMGLNFETVWMCKPRAPTFLLASHIADPEARVILDLDDNEEHFSSSKASRDKAYGLSSIGLARSIMENVTARTAASISLVQDFDALMVRHARHSTTQTAPKPSKVLKIGFIGTIRPHKNILQAAQQINTLNQQGAQQFEFHVYGDVQPENLYHELVAAGVKVKRSIPLEKLTMHLQQMDIILSSFPSTEGADQPITQYQISAKIGDALSVGRPVLVPTGPSVIDLEGTNGVYLFGVDDFSETITKVAKSLGKSKITLPKEFTLPAAYKSFLKAEQIAGTAKHAADALAMAPFPLPVAQTQETLLLIWKQHDGGLYGRRVDMIARAYRQALPNHRVVILEIIYPDFEERYREAKSDQSESAYIRAMNINKRGGNLHDIDGIEYKQIMVPKSAQIHPLFLEFLYANNILPTNTVVGLFPNILHLERIYDLLAPFPLITDVVDNQLAWAGKNNAHRVVQQYVALTRISTHVVFNSTLNLEYFRDHGLFKVAQGQISHIPNWYTLPAGFAPRPTGQRNSQTFNVFYSGNMNDRIDWDLMQQIARLDDRLRLHLIGEAGRVRDKLATLMTDNTNVIFHGVKPETMTLQLLQQADLTVMPHIVDDVSNFMNPLKVHMYAALNLPTVSSDIPGIVASDLLTISKDNTDFLDQVSRHLGAQGGISATTPGQSTDKARLLPTDAQAYVDLIQTLRDGYPTHKS